jgi:DegV family protein with EDD domain
MLKTAIIVDSVCSLPETLLDKYHIHRVPIRISIDGKEFVDPCSQAEALSLFEAGKLDRKHQVSTLPPSPDDFTRVILQAVDAGAEQVFVQTVNRMQGDTYNHANLGVSAAIQLIGDKKVTVRVMDSRTVFAGQGLMVAETLRRLLGQADANTVRRLMDSLSSKIHTYVLPKSPLLALERAQKRGEKAVGWAQAFIANTIGVHPILCIVNDGSYRAAKIFGLAQAMHQLFLQAEAQIMKGLLSPIVVINYAGPLSDLKKMPSFNRLEARAHQHKVQLITSVMSLAGGIYTSPGSINLALMAEPHPWEPALPQKAALAAV